MLFRVVLGFADGCFRVYVGLFSVDLGLVKGLFRVYLGLGYFGVLSKSCGSLRSQLTARNTANYGGYLEDTLQKVILAPS